MANINAKGVFYSRNTEYWTRTSAECFERKMVCDGCFYNETYFKHTKEKCKMKAVVLELYRKYGKPPKVEE